jgi:hypothetical protein
MIEGGRLYAVAFSLALAKIGMPGAEGHRLRRLTARRYQGGRRQGGPDPLDLPPRGRGLFSQFGMSAPSEMEAN